MFSVSVSILGVVLLAYIHYRGYMAGFKDGYHKGHERINEYAVKINHAQGETIRDLISEKNERTKNES